MKTRLLMILLFSIIIFSSIPNSFAHLEHSSAGDKILGKYLIYIGLEPSIPKPTQPTEIIFSVQDKDGNDVYDIETMVEIYYNIKETRVYVSPWMEQEIGDFSIPYTFRDAGIYQVVLSILDDNAEKNNLVPPRQFLTATSECNCVRVLFNVAVSENWSNIWNTMMIIVVALPSTVFGLAMAVNYRNLKRRPQSNFTRQELLKYIVLFLALAGGLVHLSIYIEHAPQRIEYGLFLLLAAISQIGFGTLFFSTLTSRSVAQSQKEFLKKHFRRNLALYLFGLVGSVVLFGLYTYTVIFPPPLSPSNTPEQLEIAGVFAKALELSLIGIIAYLIYWENKNRKINLEFLD